MTMSNYTDVVFFLGIMVIVMCLPFFRFFLLLTFLSLVTNIPVSTAVRPYGTLIASVRKLLNKPSMPI